MPLGVTMDNKRIPMAHIGAPNCSLFVTQTWYNNSLFYNVAAQETNRHRVGVSRHTPK